jgi:hypothetical protein
MTRNHVGFARAGSNPAAHVFPTAMYMSYNKPITFIVTVGVTMRHQANKILSSSSYFRFSHIHNKKTLLTR